jgi:integrase
MDADTVRQHMGHSSAKITWDVYGTAQMEHKKKEVQALNSLYMKVPA